MSVAVLGVMALALAAGAQDTLRPPAPVSATLAPADEAVLDLASFTQLVRARHPVARQARLGLRAAAAELRSARGVFWDPSASFTWEKKDFGGSEYYDYITAGVKVSTPIGVDLKVGVERTDPDGIFFNPDRRTPASGQLVAGVSVPLGRGIITDQRRTAIAQAAALRDAADAERVSAINKLLFAAVKDYGAWYEAERRRTVADTGVGLAQFRLDAVRARALNGDAAAIDTVEARLELERRRVQLLEASAAANAARLQVNVYLWEPDGAPLELAPDARPDLGPLDAERLDTTDASAWLARALERHPDVRKALAKIRETVALRRLAGSELLPDAAIEASALGDRATTDLLSGWPRVGENYKFALAAKQSLLLLKERGKYDATRFKADIASLESELVSREIRAGVLAALFDVVTFEQVLERQRSAVELSRRLRDGELRKFEAGESTLFLVNTRDRALLDETLKLVAFEAKYAGARAGLAFALGEPGDIDDGR